MLSHFWLDVRSAMRMLRHARGFTGVAIVTLGFGLALCITAFTVVNAYLLRTLPYPAAERLFGVRYAAPGQNVPRDMEQLDWGAVGDVIEHPIAWDLDVFYLLGGAWPESAPGAWVTPGFVAGLGIQPAMGRGFEASDFAAGRPQVALISHRLWRTRFNGDPAVVGRSFSAYVSDRPEEAELFTVIGVMPADFWHLNPYTDVFVPLRAPTYPYLVRVRPGVTPEAAAQRITAFVRGGATVPADWRLELRSVHAAYVTQLQPMLLAVGAAAGLVLLIACANVAVLLLVRASRRQKEMAVRLALGASRGRLARLLITEGLLLGGAATVVGLGVSWLAMDWLAPAIERQLGRSAPGGTSLLSIDGAVVVAAVSCGLLTICLFMLAPLAASLRSRAALALPSGGRGATEGPGPRRARTLLIAFEVAASLALLTGSALMVSSAVRMLQVDFGMEMRDVLSSNVGLRQRSYPDRARRAAFYERLLPRLARVDGVQAVAAGDWWPLQPPRPRVVKARSGQAGAGQAGSEPTQAGVMAVSPAYFATLRIPLRDGREFIPEDRLGGPAVAIVSATLARRLWPGARAVGQDLTITPDEGDRREGEPSEPSTRVVVGVVSDVKQSHTDADLADVYVPLIQRAGRFAFVYTRVPGASNRLESDLRTAVGDVDREVAIGTPRFLQAVLDQERSRPRFLASLLVGFAGFAGVLALVGVYGAIAYAVRQREREIAVRMAIGADRHAVVQLFVRQGTLVLATGLILGVGAALASGRLLESQLYGVRPGDPWLLAFTTLGFAACGLLAIWLPARRAAATDPAVSLRTE